MLTLLLIACGTGSLSFNEQDRVLRSAWALDDDEARGILLSTSHLPCDTEGQKNPTEALLETQEISHARSREGSLLIWVPLANETLPGEHRVTISGHEVLEAERMWTDGLIANYRPTEIKEFTTEGLLQLDRLTTKHWFGSLNADSPALQADFRADICPTPEVLQILGLIGLN